MATDKNETPRGSNQQPTQPAEAHINPFREAADKPETPPTPEEEAAREQQLKEAMTERD